MENKFFKQRMQKLKEVEGHPFYNEEFCPEHHARDIVERFKPVDSDTLLKRKDRVSVAGRILSIRSFGKIYFMHVQDTSGKIQIYIQKGAIDDEIFGFIKKLDIGDIVGIRGYVFKTKTGEVTIFVEEMQLLTKSFRPLPEKWHGLKDKELRYRERYVDLIVNQKTREVVKTRAKILGLLRRFMDKKGFIEVETPMMQNIIGGASARPFKTYHNALNMDLYMRIAPELFLKRLVVGGLENVYELNRNFRNEGIDIKHNPEFTMLEFYTAYHNYKHLMNFTEELFDFLLKQLNLGKKIIYGEHTINFSRPWRREKFYDALRNIGNIDEEIIKDKEKAYKMARDLGKSVSKDMSMGKILEHIFDATVEPQLIDPTFVMDYPVDTSPLAKRNKQDPSIVDRFELYIGGMEIANAFSELNDPIDQRNRFLMQVKEKEMKEEEIMDEDYIKALEYGLPPTAGEGIGVDRLVMILTNQPSIRDVILFPLLREK